nr:YuzD family protein [Lysinibacillus timonensis]
MNDHPMIEVFGANVLCASCINAPSSKDTFEWLQAAIHRKYPNQPYIIRYIDIEQPQINKRDQEWVNRIQNDEYFFPLVLINDEVVGEGFIQISPIFSYLENLGFVPAD